MLSSAAAKLPHMVSIRGNHVVCHVAVRRFINELEFTSVS